MPQQPVLIGGVQLTILARRIQAAGDKDLPRELRKGLNRATKPLRKQAKANAKAVLPKRGGLGARVSRTKLTTRTRLGRNVSVDIVAKPGAVADPRRIDRGKVRHPVYGHRDRMVLQDVPKGWFTDPMRDGEPEVHRELARAIAQVSAKLGRGL